MKIAEAFVELRVDGKKAEQETKSQGRKLGETFAQVFGAAAFGLGLKKAIDAGSRLEQSVGAIEAVFGGATKAIDAWAKASAKSMGLSEAASREALSLIGAQLKNFGFSVDQAADKGMELVELGADLAATFGGTTTEAVQALTAALRGEMDPIERYGVSLNEARLKAKAFELGLYDGKGALDANAKAQASLALITDQTAAASGQFARELDTVAGKQAVATAESENAAASLGQALAPIYERLVDTVTFLAEGFAALPAPLQYFTVGLLGFVALAGPIGKVSEMFGKVADSVRNMSTSGQLALGAFGAALGIISLVTMAYSSQAREKARLRAVTDGYVQALEAERNGQRDAALQQVAAALANDRLNVAANKMFLTTQDLADFVMGKSVPALDVLRDTYKVGTGEIEDNVVPALMYLKETYGLNQEEATALVGILNEQATQFGIAAEEVAREDEALRALGVATDQVADKTEAAAAANAGLKKSVEGTFKAFEDAADAADALRTAIDAVFAPTDNFAQAQEDLQAAIDNVAQSFKDNGKTLDINTDKGRANRQAIREQADAIKATGVALVGLGYSNQAAGANMRQMTDQLRDQLVNLDLTEEAANAYITELGLTPENIETSITLAREAEAKAKLGEMIDQLGDIDEGAAAEIEALIDEGKYGEAEQRLKDIARTRGVKLNVSLAGGGQVSISGVTGGQMYRVVASAEGNVFDRPTMSLFGEAGAEAILPLERPRALSRILSDPRVAGPVAAAMGGESVSGGGVQIGTVNVGSRSDYDALADRLDRLAWRIAT